MSLKKPKKDGVVKTAILVVQGVNVTVGRYQERDYINLNDIVAHVDGQRYLIEEWIRSKKTLNFLASWERKNNPDFDQLAYADYMLSLSDGRTSSVGRWVKSVNGVGLCAEMGRYGGTYAHKHIAFEFAGYIDSDFKLYLIEEVDRLKEDEAKRNNEEWDVKREIARINYRLMTGKIQEHLLDGLPAHIHRIVYATEADIINKTGFGFTHQEWKGRHPDLKKNQRDHGTVLDNHVIATLQVQNALMIDAGLSREERIDKLTRLGEFLRDFFKDDPGMDRLSNQYDTSKLENKD